MPEKEKATVGKTVAGTAVSTNGSEAHPHDSTDGGETYPTNLGSSHVLGELHSLLEQAKVEPADILSAKKVAALLPQVATYQGLALQAAFDSLRILISYLPADERKALYPAFVEHKLFARYADWEQYLATCPEPPGSPRFKPLTLAELLLLPPKVWLIDQLLGAGDLAMLYGPPGSGKTFIVIDLLFAACLGKQFAMRFDVLRPLTVAYAAGEGVSGLPARFAAAAEHYGINNLPNLTVFDAAPQLFDESSADSLGRFVAEWRERQAAGQVGALDLLVIDTMHSATLGADENSAQDMGRVLAMAKAATKLLGCTVLMLHHSNKAGTAERGSSALKGAMDAQIEVKPVAGKYVMHCEKLKDGEQWKDQTFDLVAMGESVRVWWDEPGGELPNSSGKLGSKLRAELQGRPGVKFGAKQLAEAVGCTQAAAINGLARLVEKGEIKRSLQDEKREPSSRNPWVFFVDPTA
jgi:hypothetical protein